MELVGSWATLQSSSIVKLFGVTLKGPVSMVTEYLYLGPFDAYLRENKLRMKEVDLVEAGTYLASALWHLVRDTIAFLTLLQVVNNYGINYRRSAVLFMGIYGVRNF